MKCPHCNTAFNVEWDDTKAYFEGELTVEPDKGKGIYHTQCPECNNIIVKLVRGFVDGAPGEEFVSDIETEETIYPMVTARPVEPEVPEPYKNDFIEACKVLSISPRASAALSRRLLQQILREQFGIKKKNLAMEIEDFIHLKNVPSHLTEAVDAVRNIGNFAAHPLKDTNTGSIIEVEPGEADWLLEVIDELFDFAFVQPKRLEERKNRLNAKLKSMGKPPMKDKS
jgi:hypothetical protein